MARMTRGEQVAVSLFGKTFARAQAFLYEHSGGRLGGRFMGAPVMVVTTIGRKSGRPRRSPLLYLREGSSLVTVASKGGYPSHPAWYLNMQRTPQVSVQIGNESRTMRARTATAEERARLWPRLTSMYKPYAEYQSKTEREIPVVILEPAS